MPARGLILVLLVLVGGGAAAGGLLDGGGVGPAGGGAETGAAVGRVLRVVDGDTIDVQVGATREKVRYIGVDTPESALSRYDRNDRSRGCQG